MFLKCVCTDPGVQGSVCVGSGSWTHYCWGVMRAVIRDEGLPPETGQETDCPEHTPGKHTQIHTVTVYNWIYTGARTGLLLYPIKCLLIKSH